MEAGGLVPDELVAALVGAAGAAGGWSGWMLLGWRGAGWQGVGGAQRLAKPPGRHPRALTHDPRFLRCPAQVGARLAEADCVQHGWLLDGAVARRGVRAGWLHWGATSWQEALLCQHLLRASARSSGGAHTPPNSLPCPTCLCYIGYPRTAAQCTALKEAGIHPDLLLSIEVGGWVWLGGRLGCGLAVGRHMACLKLCSSWCSSTPALCQCSCHHAHPPIHLFPSPPPHPCQVPDAVLVARVAGRRLDPDTGHIYHLTFKPPPPEVADRLVRGAHGGGGGGDF